MVSLKVPFVNPALQHAECCNVAKAVLKDI